MARQLFELCGTDPARMFSPYCWRTRMALAHKGLEFEYLPWRFTERARIAPFGSDKVPVLLDGEAVVADSWAIAQYLDRTYPDRPTLMPGGIAAYRFVNLWADTVVNPGIGRMIVSDIPDLLGPEDRAYFVESREARFGKPLAEVTADREVRLPEFRASLIPARHALRGQEFLGGAGPDYSDYILFGSLMWGRICSDFALLAPEDPLHAWQERMLDLHGGLARRIPARAASPALAAS